MTELKQLVKNLNDAMRAEVDYLISNSVPDSNGGEGVYDIIITTDMLPEIKRLAEIKKDAQKALREYTESNPLETI